MIATLTAIITFEVADKKEAIFHITRFMEVLNSYEEVEKIEIEKLEVFDEPVVEQLRLNFDE